MRLPTLVAFIRSDRYLKHVLLAALSLTGACAAQTGNAPENPFSQELRLSKYPGLIQEFGKLAERLRNEVQPPPDRSRSQILPVLPESTTYYVAFANYGDAAHQALRIFEDELRHSAVLRDWWGQTLKGADGAKFENAVEKFYELSQYLGDEIVASGNTEAHIAFTVVAPVRKPGLKGFLASLTQEWPGISKPVVRVLDEQELAAVGTDNLHEKTPVILVRGDFVIAAPDLEAAREFNRALNRKDQTFPSTAFGARLLQSYQSGTGFLAGADLQRMLRQMPSGEPPQAQEMLTSTGFDNVKFLIWQHKGLFGESGSQMEIGFSGPRHGIPAWLAAPGELGSLDFASPNAVMVWAVRLKNLAEIFDDVRTLAMVTNPNSFASLDQMQQMLGVDLRNDLLSHLQGETTFELNGVADQKPEWKAILRVNDPEQLQRTLSKLLSASGQTPTPSVVDGVRYYSFVVPSPKATTQSSYTFADGYMVIASTQQLAEQSIQMHRSGTSLAKSGDFSSARGGAEQVSGLMYYAPTAMWAGTAQTASPELAAQLFSHLQSTPVLVRTYADEDRIRVASNSGGADAGAIMVLAAIAVPNLLRARISANESSAVGTMRTIVTAQVSYSAMYPAKGYARDLASLGRDSGSTSPQHAGLLDWTGGDASCSGRTECMKSGYRFTMSSRCTQNKCGEFTVVATPLSSNTGVRSFCAMSDGVLRFSLVSPAENSISSSKCQGWTRLP